MTIHRFIQCLIVLLLAIAISGLASCGRSRHSSSVNLTELDTRNMLTVDGVSLRAFDEQGAPILNIAERYRLEVLLTGELRTVSVTTKTPLNSAASYLELRFNPSKEQPASVQAGEALASYQPFTYLGSPEAGLVIAAQVIPNFARQNITGELLKVLLQPGTHTVREISKINQDSNSDPIITDVYVEARSRNKISWRFKLRGDSNQNQVFDFADFGVVGSNYQQKVAESPSCEPADGDKNGQIDFADFGYIGANFGKGIGALNLYRGENEKSLAKIGTIEVNGKVKGDFKLILTRSTSSAASGFNQQSFELPSTGSGGYGKLELLDENGDPLPGHIASIGLPVGTGLQGDWWMFGCDQTHNRRSSFTGPQTNALKWSYTTGSFIYSSPAIGSDGTIYIGSWDNKLYAFNANGTVKWSYATGSFIHASPAIGADGTIYVGSYDNKLYALNPDGTLKWSYTTGSTVYSSPAIGADGTIYVGSYDNKLYALNPDGTLKWSYTTGSVVYSSPAIGADGTIYVGSHDHKLYALNPDGTLKWSYATGMVVNSSPAISTDGTIYFGSGDDKLYALNPDGTLKWSYATGMVVNSSPAISTDGTIYFGSGDDKLYALNSDGTLKWSYATGSIESSPAISADGTIYVGSYDNKLYALNPDGTLKWSYTTGNYINSSPAIGADGTVYVGSKDNKLYAFGQADPLSPPTNLKASDGAYASKIELTWNHPATGSTPTGYDIYRSATQTGTYTKIGSVGYVTSYEDTSVLPEVTNWYKIKSTKSGLSDSLFSSEDEGSTKKSEAGDWWMFGREPTHNLRSPFTGPQTNTLLWSLSLGGIIESSPSIGADGTIYVGCSNRKLYALNSTGTVKWYFTTSGVVYSSPAISAEGTIYFGCEDDNFYAINPDGKLKWMYKTGNNVSSSPAIGADGTIYVGSEDRKLYAFTPDGKVKWSFTAGDKISWSSPAIGSDGTIYVGSYDDKLYAIKSDGTKKWDYKTRGDILSSPSIDADGTIYIGSNDRKLYAIRPDGSKKWEYNTSGFVYSTPAIGSDGTIYVGSRDQYLHAVNPIGTRKWRFLTSGWIETSPSIGADMTIYIGSNDNNIYAVNPNGTRKWYYRSNSDVECVPAIGADGSLYIGHSGGLFYAFRDSMLPLSEPTNLAASDGTYDNKIELTWNHPATGSTPTGYDIYRSDTQTGTYTKIGSVGYVTSYNDTSSTAGVTWWYKIKSTKSGLSDSNFCTEDSGYLMQLNPPIDVSASDGTYASKIELTWNHPATGSTPTGYDIYRSATQTGTYTKIGSVGFVTSYDDTAVTVGATWWYKLKSTKAGLSDSAYSLEDQGSTSSDGPGEFWMYGRDLLHTRRTTVIGPSTNKLKWTYPTGGEIFSSPAHSASGTVYFGNYEGYFFAVNPNGTLKWTYKVGDIIEGSPAVGKDGTIYFGAYDKYFYAINPNGTLKWRYLTSHMINTSPAIDSDGTIYIASVDSTVYAFNPNGTTKWMFSTGTSMYLSSPAVSPDGTVYIGCFDGAVYAMNTTNGSLKWKYQTGGAICSSPALAPDGTVYFGSYDKSIYAVSPTGTLKWSVPTGNQVGASPGYSADGTVYVGSSDGAFYAINPSDGTIKWKFEAGGSFAENSPCIDGNGSVYVGNTNYNVYALDSSGTLLWSYKTGGPVVTAPTIGTDGSVYFGSYDKKLHVIGPGF